MKCIILNSGMGTRLNELTENNPKSLVKLSDSETIFSKAVSILKQFDIDEFIITTGYLSEILQEYSLRHFPQINFTFVHNPVYDKTNYIKSLDLIGDIDDDVILLHGDLVFSKNVASKIINAENTSVVVDSTIDLPKDDFKAKIQDDSVKYIGVDYFGEDAVACQPFYKLSKKDWKSWKDKINEFCINGDTNVYAENALNQITSDVKVYPMDIKGDICMEIDNKEDLLKVKEILQ